MLIEKGSKRGNKPGGPIRCSCQNPLSTATSMLLEAGEGARKFFCLKQTFFMLNDVGRTGVAD